MAQAKGIKAVLSPEEKKRQELAQSLNLPKELVPSSLMQEYYKALADPTVLVVSGGSSAPTPPPPAPTLQPYTFKIGDPIKIISNRAGHGFPIGHFGRITSGNKSMNSSDPYYEVDDGNNAYATDMELVKAVEVKKEEVKKQIPFESVVMTDEKREEIKAAISQFENNDLLFTEWGFSEVFEKGTAVTLLFYGIPGGGKTLCAQAIAEELGAELKIYGMAEIGSSEPGGSERIIQKIFKTAKDFFFTKKKHQVILFDECDALLYDRNKVGVILGAQINTLLTEIERHDGIVIFTTNRLGVLDPALERRVAAKIEFPFPNREQREAIWKRMIPAKAPIAKDVDYYELSKYPLAGGNIKNAVLNAARMASYKKQKHITMNNFVTAIEKEAESQAEFEANYDRGNAGRGWATSNKPMDDYGVSEGRELQIDSVFNVNREEKKR